MFPLFKLGLCKVGQGQQIRAEDNKSRSGTTNSGKACYINLGEKNLRWVERVCIVTYRIRANQSPEIFHFYFCLFSFCGTHLILPLSLTLSGIDLFSTI